MVKVIMVDENDNPIGLKERDTWEDGEIHRVGSLWLSNSKGEVLLARRALEKKHAAGKWGPAAAGTVDEGETYEMNIVKETEEEIGVSISPEQLTIGPKVLMGPPNNRRFIQWFFATLDVPIESLRFQPEEVMDARWVSLEDLKKWRSESPADFVKTIEPILEIVLK